MTQSSDPSTVGRAPIILAFSAVVVLLFALSPAVAARAAGKAAVASESRRATQAALAQMRGGGNAIDAAVTAALVAGVTNPTSSGIGGGGFAVVWSAKDRRAVVLDFREVAPKAIDAPAFERRPLPPAQRGKLVGVPGEPAGLFELHKRFGKRPWAEVVQPAVDAAMRGYTVGPHVASVLSYYGTKLVDAELLRLFTKKGRGLPFGAHVKNEPLGRTLARFAAEGPKAIYEGAIAADIVKAARDVGGALTAADLSAYGPTERKPIHVRWEGHDVYTMGPPSAGGLMLAQALRLFSRAELERLGFNSGAYQHMVAEGMRAAIADRMRAIGDPDHQKVDLDYLLSEKRLAARKRSLSVDRTHAIPRFGLEEHGTHHLVTADESGNMVSLTTTVNRAFGAKIVAPASGIVLNDELDDFSPRAAVAPFGMKQSPNRPRPGARPVSSMTPTIVVKDGAAVLGLGGSGGMTIATNVTQIVLSRLVFGHSPTQALRARRFSVPTRGAYISLEKGAKAEHVQDLERRGEIVSTMRFSSHAVQMIAVEKGRKLAASDPRKHGTARAY